MIMATAEARIETSNGDETLSEIVILEDEEVSEEIVRVLKSFGCKTRRVESGDQAVELAEQGEAEFFILDIQMGEHRKNEGLDALEGIKSLDRKNFVAIYSAHPKWYHEQAERLGADVFR